MKSSKKNFSSFHDKITEIQECVAQLKPLSGTNIIIKCGGARMHDEEFLDAFAADIFVLNSLGIGTIIIHGAGGQLEKLLSQFKLKNEFLDGYRVTNAETMEAAEMVLTGLINKKFIKYLAKHNVNAIGLSCKDGNLVKVKKLRRTKRDEDSNIERIIDLGYVGEPDIINEEFLNQIIDDLGFTPVISPVAFDSHYNTHSVNADVLACAIGGAIKASKIVIISENMNIKSSNGVLTGSISLNELEKIAYHSTILPQLSLRIKSCINAMKNGVSNIHIIDIVPHTLLTELTCNTTTGTMIYDHL